MPCPAIPSFLVRLLSVSLMAPVPLLIIWYGGWPFWALMALVALRALYEWGRMIAESDYAFLYFCLGTLYLGLSVGSFLLLRLMMPEGAILALLLILMVAASDTTAYVFGKLLGGPKLVPNLSPKKTWAGFFGACFGAGGILVLCLSLAFWMSSHLLPLWGLTLSFIPVLFIVGCLLGALGQAGDLLVSFFKRQAGIKDTGQLIPGHGGLLDRIDALLLVCPFFVFLLSFFSGAF